MILEQVVVLFPIVAYWTLKEGVACICGFILNAKCQNRLGFMSE